MSVSGACHQKTFARKRRGWVFLLWAAGWLNSVSQEPGDTNVFRGSQCSWKRNLRITKYGETTFVPKDASGDWEAGGASHRRAPLARRPATSRSRWAAVPGGMLCSRPAQPLVLVTVWLTMGDL